MANNIIISGDNTMNCFSSRTPSTQINATEPTFTFSASSSASGSGTNLDIVLKNVFQSLIDAVINSINPNLNPNEKGYVYTTIDSTINLVTNFFDSNNNQTIVPIVFNISTSSSLSIGSSGTITGRGGSITLNSSSTSASISGTLGQLLLLLDKQIPTISSSLRGAVTIYTY